MDEALVMSGQGIRLLRNPVLTIHLLTIKGSTGWPGMETAIIPAASYELQKKINGSLRKPIAMLTIVGSSPDYQSPQVTGMEQRGRIAHRSFRRFINVAATKHNKAVSPKTPGFYHNGLSPASPTKLHKCHQGLVRPCEVAIETGSLTP